MHFGLTFGACTTASVSYIGACTTIRGNKVRVVQRTVQTGLRHRPQQVRAQHRGGVPRPMVEEEREEVGERGGKGEHCSFEAVNVGFVRKKNNIESCSFITSNLLQICETQRKSRRETSFVMF